MVVLVDELFYLSDESLNAFEGSTPDSSLSDNVEPDFYLVKP